MKCTLSVEINTCTFCDKEKMKCKNEKKCSFQEDNVNQVLDKYVRKERWYEKYYKNK